MQHHLDDSGHLHRLPLPEGTEYQVSCKVRGGEYPSENTFTIEGGTVTFREEEFTSTRPSTSKLVATVTEVEKL
ncbi:hypothetical protein [Streptosporangium sp. NPDC049644]|uniref:hypothetical protein n=1 Tax=Streptosporangium sp. NPDC049644 TaxID=3155507 RepID=UPI0034475A90